MPFCGRMDQPIPARQELERAAAYAVEKFTQLYGQSFWIEWPETSNESSEPVAATTGDYDVPF